MSQRTSVFFLVMISALWGLQFPLISILLESGLSPVEITFFRILIAFFALRIFMSLQKEAFPKEIRFWLLAFALGVSGDFLAQFLIAMGQKSVNAGLSSVLIATSPFFTFILGLLLPGKKRQRISVYQVLALIVGFSGVFVLSHKSLQMSADSIGILYLVLAALLFAVTNLVAESASRYSGVAVSCASLLVMSALLLPFDARHLSLEHVLHLNVAAVIVTLAVMCTACAFVLMIRLAGGTNASYLSYSNFLVPIFGLMFSSLILQEQVTLDSLLAVLLILIGVVLLNFSGNFKKREYEY